MTEISYQPPVARLLAYGDPRNLPAWPEELDYLLLGFGPEHIPDLIRLTTDQDLRWTDSEDLETWASIHAWRTLGQLRAEQAVEPLLGLLALTDERDDEWVLEELPDVFGMIGPAALAPLAAYLADAGHGLWARITAAASLAKIGIQHPQTRDACVAALTQTLEHFAENDEELNADVIYNLTELHATEAVELIQRAFDAGRVDEFIMGGWPEVQVELGLIPAPPDDLPRFRWDVLPPETPAGPPPAEAELRLSPDLERSLARQLRKSDSKTKAKAKAKRKQANQSRKRNRKR